MYNGSLKLQKMMMYNMYKQLRVRKIKASWMRMETRSQHLITYMLMMI